MYTRKIKELELIARKVRAMSFQLILTAGSGHLGGCSSSTELMVAMYFGGILKYDPGNPRHPGRDRVIIRGHLGPLRYSIFNLLGWVGDTELDTYRRLGSRLQGHESMGALPGVDITPSGMLGMVLSYGVGSAIALSKQDIPATTWVFLGDGEEQEGNISEAARHAANIRLNNLVCILDRNGKQLSKQTKDVDGASDLKKIWDGYGWQVEEITDGNSITQILNVLEKPRVRNCPTLFIANTVKGLGLRDSEYHPSGYHTISSCPKDAVREAISSTDPILSKVDLDTIVCTRLSAVERPILPVSTALSEPPKIHLSDTDVPEDGLIEYLSKMIIAVKDDPLLRLYVMTADVTVKNLALLCGFYQPHVVYVDPGIREQHLVGVAHGIAVSDPNSLIMVMESDAFMFRAIDQLNAVCQAGSRMIIFGNDSGLCSAKNGSTHQTVGQPGALINMCGLTFLEPADVVDLENCLNWAVNHQGPVYIRFHDGTVRSFAVSEAERNLVAYTAYDPRSQPKVIVVASGLPTGEAVKLAISKDKDGVGMRVVNVINPKDLGAEFASMMIGGIPVLTVYNGNPDILQSAVAKAVMEYPGSRPSVISGHGYRLGTSGKLEDLLGYFRLDAGGIGKEIQRRFPSVG